jgi:hypothetical protein
MSSQRLDMTPYFLAESSQHFTGKYYFDLYGGRRATQEVSKKLSASRSDESVRMGKENYNTDFRLRQYASEVKDVATCDGKGLKASE